MKLRYPRLAATLFVASTLTVAGIAAGHAAPPKGGDHTGGAQDACMKMMQDPGVTEQGRQSMREYMQSPKAGPAMRNMMEMARRMGAGDPMLGMTKMMDMMGGGMMGGSGGMMSPDASPSTK